MRPTPSPCPSVRTLTPARPQIDMCKFPMLHDLDPSTFHFAQVAENPITRSKNVPIYFDDRDTTWANKIQLQLCCDNEEDYLRLPYGIDTPLDESQYRRNLQIVLHDAMFIDKLRAFDEVVKAKAQKCSKEWFRKEYDATAIELKYKPLLHYDDERKQYTMKVKVQLPQPPKRDGDKAPKPTEILCKDEDDETRLIKGSWEKLTKNSKVMPVVSTMGVWFMGDSSFGVSFKAEQIIVKPHKEADMLQRMNLARAYHVVTEEEARDAKRLKTETPYTGEDDVVLEGDEDDDGKPVM